jgi:DNA modification methylase
MNKIINKDCINGLKEIPEKTIQTCVTSPPYFGLRDYGVNGQLGLENTPEEYVQKMVQLFREVHRVLKDDGTLWLNLGDSYFSSTKGSGGSNPDTSPKQRYKGKENAQGGYSIKLSPGELPIKPKDLIGIPWRVAFALQADGWYLRQDIIWHKPNPMPESITDRCTKSHEYIFLLSKSPNYYFDNESIKEPLSESSMSRLKQNIELQNGSDRANGQQKKNGNLKAVGDIQSGKRNKRSVWTVATKPYKEAHFAVFPDTLITPCILAGSKEGDIVLDPFMGSGTTAEVALRLGRQYLGFEINPEYVELAEKRLSAHQNNLFVKCH